MDSPPSTPPPPTLSYHGQSRDGKFSVISIEGIRQREEREYDIKGEDR